MKFTSDVSLALSGLLAMAPSARSTSLTGQLCEPLKPDRVRNKAVRDQPRGG